MIKVYTLILFSISVIQYILPSFYFTFIWPLMSMRNEPSVLNPLRANQAVGLSNGSGENALMMSIGFCIFISEAVAEKTNRVRNSFLSICFFVMTFLTEKRSYSLINIGIFVVLMIFATPKRNRTLIVTLRVFLILLCFVGVLVSNIQMHFLDSVIDKFSRLSEAGDISNGRLDLYSATIKIVESNPFLGIGVNSMMATDVGLVHSSYLQWLAEFGLIGMWIPLFGFVFFPIKLMIQARRCYGSVMIEKKRFCILACCALILMYLVSGIVAATFQSHNHFMLLTVCIATLANQLYSFGRTENT